MPISDLVFFSFVSDEDASLLHSFLCMLEGKHDEHHDPTSRRRPSCTDTEPHCQTLILAKIPPLWGPDFIHPVSVPPANQHPQNEIITAQSRTSLLQQEGGLSLRRGGALSQICEIGTTLIIADRSDYAY